MYLSAIEDIGAEMNGKTNAHDGPMTCAQAEPAEIAKNIFDHGKRRSDYANEKHTDTDGQTDRETDRKTD